MKRKLRVLIIICFGRYALLKKLSIVVKREQWLRWQELSISHIEDCRRKYAPENYKLVMEYMSNTAK